jgi:hypothetical protein
MNPHLNIGLADGPIPSIANCCLLYVREIQPSWIPCHCLNENRARLHALTYFWAAKSGNHRKVTRREENHD